MASVVFMRGVNVGGHKKFQPSTLAKDLAHLEVVNVGAAGTFVVRKPIGEKALRGELQRRLPFEAELMICGGREVLELLSAEPFADEIQGDDIKQYVTILGKKPSKRSAPRLPIRRPDNDDWQVKIVRVIGRFVLSLHRRRDRTLVYPNEVVEKAFAVPATTRNWNTMAAIAGVLREKERHA